MSHDARKPVFRVFDQVRHKQVCTVSEEARSVKFQILEEEKLYMYYLCSENKGADQLCSYSTADLHLCFRIGNNPAAHIVLKDVISQYEL